MTKGSDHLTTAEAWRVWKKACAADLCPAPEALALRQFGIHRFNHYLNRYAARLGRQGQVPRVAESGDAWHLLETYAQVGATREGKRYKDWLFARAPDQPHAWLNAVEAGATLLMRGAVREYLRREHAAAFMESMHRPLDGTAADSSFTLEELLPDTAEPLHTIAEKEWHMLAQQQAERWYLSLYARERIVLWAREQGYSLADPDLVKWAGCRKSVLHSTYTNCIHRLCHEIKGEFPDETPAIWLMLTRKALEALKQIISLKIMSEKGAARFFKKKGIGVESGMATDEMART